jgi:hypothetical protein
VPRRILDVTDSREHQNSEDSGCPEESQLRSKNSQTHSHKKTLEFPGFSKRALNLTQKNGLGHLKTSPTSNFQIVISYDLGVGGLGLRVKSRRYAAEI